MSRMIMSPSPDGKRRSTYGARGGFAGGEGIQLEPAPKPETAEEREAREKKEAKEAFTVLTKEESVAELSTQKFDDFLMRAGRIVERALDCDVDVVGDFFAEEDADEALLRKSKGDKITQ